MSGAVSCVNRKREALEPASKAATRELSLCICSDTSAEFILFESNRVSEFGYMPCKLLQAVRLAMRVTLPSLFCCYQPAILRYTALIRLR